MITRPIPSDIEALDWTEADTAVIDRSAHYAVETNDDVREVWDGTTLEMRRRAEFHVGRAVWVARIPEATERAA